MKRREFFGHSLAAGAALGGSLQATVQVQDLKSWERIVTSKEDELTTNGYPWISGNTFKMGQVVFERDASGKPHTGKVLAAIQPHSDDIPLFSAGTVAKLMKEGYTGFLSFEPATTRWPALATLPTPSWPTIKTTKNWRK